MSDCVPDASHSWPPLWSPNRISSCNWPTKGRQFLFLSWGTIVPEITGSSLGLQRPQSLLYSCHRRLHAHNSVIVSRFYLGCCLSDSTKDCLRAFSLWLKPPLHFLQMILLFKYMGSLPAAPVQFYLSPAVALCLASLRPFIRPLALSLGHNQQSICCHLTNYFPHAFASFHTYFCCRLALSCSDGSSPFSLRFGGIPF